MNDDQRSAQYRPITPATSVSLQHLGQLGHTDSFSYPKHVQWHPTAPLLALSYPLNEPVGTARLALWTPWGTCRSTITETGGARGKWYSVGWSADGQIWAYGFKSVQIARHEGNLQRAIPGQSLSWSPHNHLLATSDRTRIMLWDLDRGQMTVLPDSDGIELGWNRTCCWVDATTLRGATATHIHTWYGAGIEQDVILLAPPFQPAARSVQSIPTWSPTGHAVAVWTDTEVAIVGHDGAIHSIVPSGTTPCFRMPVAWHPSRAWLATIDDWDVQLWDVRGTRITTFVGTHYGVACLAWSPDGQILATGSWDSTICLWSQDGVLLQTVFTAPTRRSMRAVFLLDWSPDSRYLVASLRDCTIQVYAIPIPE